MSMFSHAIRSVASHPLSVVNPVFSAVSSAIHSATGMDWRQQLMAGGGIGAGAGALRVLGAPQAGGLPGLQGGPPLVNGEIPVSSSSAGGLTRALGSNGLSALAGAGADVFGEIEQRRAVQDANENNLNIARESMGFSAQQAQREMDFQERMSNTSYQRGVEDMRKAGINPMLAINNGGASSPSGAMGSGATATMAPVPGVVHSIVSGAKDFMGFIQGLRESNSKIASNYADVGLKSASTRAKSFEANLSDTVSHLFDAFKNKLQAGVNSAKSAGNFDLGGFWKEKMEDKWIGDKYRTSKEGSEAYYDRWK